MKLSFVIPAHNEEAYISKCLSSILAEVKRNSYDYEIIVVNNSSTDNTKAIALKFVGVKVVDEPKKGITWARQAGYLAACGDLIANVDADNVIPKDWMNIVFREFIADNEVIGLSGPYKYYDLSWLINIEVKIFYILGYLTYLMNQYIFGSGSMLQGGNFVVRKSALDRIGGYNLDIDFYGEDTDVARRLQKVGDVKFTFDLPMFSSGRRLSKDGILVSGCRYAINYFWVLIFKRPFSKESIDIRSDDI
jgi:glycosyltransferase involved in cell wall biosynthesis